MMPSFYIVGVEKIAIWLPRSRRTRISLPQKTMVIIGYNPIQGIGISVRAAIGPADAYSVASENPPRSPNLNRPSRGQRYAAFYI